MSSRWKRLRNSSGVSRFCTTPIWISTSVGRSRYSDNATCNWSIAVCADKCFWSGFNTNTIGFDNVGHTEFTPNCLTLPPTDTLVIILYQCKSTSSPWMLCGSNLASTLDWITGSALMFCGSAASDCVLAGFWCWWPACWLTEFDGWSVVSTAGLVSWLVSANALTFSPSLGATQGGLS